MIEQDMYGSSRLGIVKQEKLIQRFNYTGSLDTSTGIPAVTSTLLDTTIADNDSIFSRVLGNKRYELTNHLGNVLATVSDRKLQHSSNLITVDYYLPDIITATDYYAFGAEMKTYNVPACHYNVTVDTTYQNIYDTTFVVTMLNPGDQITMNVNGTNYILASFNPTYTTVQQYINDILAYPPITGFTFMQVGTTDTVHLEIDQSLAGLSCGDNVTITVGTNPPYSLSITCTPTITYDSVQVCDTACGYRYGFNGKEKDDETYGEGNEYDFGARIYDSRLGRFLTKDPLNFIDCSLSPYIYAGNDPINFIDFNGEFRMSCKLQAKYPKLMLMLIYAKDYIKSDPELYNKFLSLTGITEKEFDYIFTWGSGPKIKIYNYNSFVYLIARFMSPAGDPEAWNGLGGIWLYIHDVDQLDFQYCRPQDYYDKLAGLFSILMHEATHEATGTSVAKNRTLPEGRDDYLSGTDWQGNDYGFKFQKVLNPKIENNFDGAKLLGKFLHLDWQDPFWNKTRDKNEDIQPQDCLPDYEDTPIPKKGSRYYPNLDGDENGKA